MVVLSHPIPKRVRTGQMTAVMLKDKTFLQHMKDSLPTLTQKVFPSNWGLNMNVNESGVLWQTQQFICHLSETVSYGVFWAPQLYTVAYNCLKTQGRSGFEPTSSALVCSKANSTVGTASWLAKKLTSPGNCSELTLGPGQFPPRMQLSNCLWRGGEKKETDWDLME